MQNKTLTKFKRQLPLHIFAWCGLLFLFTFSILPMVGLQMAFREFDLLDGFAGLFHGQPVGFKYFREFVKDRQFPRLMRNTIIISALKLLFSVPIPVIFAILLDEMPSVGYKRVVQTVSYLPHFISWVVVAGILQAFFSTTNGLMNNLMLDLGLWDKPTKLLYNPDQYYALAVVSDLWKETGWNAIIYLAAISGIDPGLYESAKIDGAGRLQRIRHITLPAILPTIIIIFILSVGGLVSGNFDQTMMLSNARNVSRSMILDVYVYEMGLGLNRYSYATAAGLFQSVISLLLVLIANGIARKSGEVSLF